MPNDIIDYDPWHGDPGNGVSPHRPSLAQLGGGEYEDDLDPPDVQTMPSAKMENVNERTLAGIARTAAVLILSIRFSGGVPSVTRATFADQEIEIGDLTVTDNGAGDTSITWAANTLPVPVCYPFGLTMNEINTVERTAALEITNGIRVHTQNGSGTGVDTNFTVCVG